MLKEYRELNKQDSKGIKYNSIKNNKLGKEIKQLTNEIKKNLFNDDTSILYASKKDIKKDLDNLNEYFNKLNEDNNIKEYIKSNSIVDKKEQYIDNYIYNSIVNHSLYKYEHIEMIVKNRKIDNITLDDLIQEVAYQNKIRDER